MAAQSFQIIVFPSFLQALLTEPGWHLSPRDAGLIGSTIFLGMLAGATTAVPLAQRFGRRRATLAAVLWLTLSSGACALATAPWQLGFLRMLAGIGMGAAIVLILGFANDATAENKGAFGIALFGMPVVGIVTPPIMGELAVDGAWRVMTVIGAGVGSIAFALAVWLLPHGADISIVTVDIRNRATSTSRVVVWTSIGLIGATVIVWSSFRDFGPASLGFGTVLNTGVVITLFVVAGTAIHRHETPGSLARTVRTTVAFVLINPPTFITVFVVVVVGAFSKDTTVVMTLFGAWIADSYGRSLTFSITPDVFEALPRSTTHKVDHTTPVPHDVRPRYDR
ncbi:MFS transporter [Nocardia salmonicida]|uniref:MFS transporter n=1 Tax=Nocardia salmonicida TaxID=53431 RepID=UPI002E2A68D4|nr:MFS transporter [Nocardia salmonicida]